MNKLLNLIGNKYVHSLDGFTIADGQTALASDFVSTSAGASDSGKVAKLGADGKIDASFLRFGGTGADGALTLTSGTANYDLGGASVFIKNFTTISITGTANITFTNPHANGTLIIFKSTLGSTITSSATPTIDVTSMGADSASKGNTNFVFQTNKGVNGDASGASLSGAGGAALGVILSRFYKGLLLGCGGGGGNGDYNGGTNARRTGGGGASVVTSGTGSSGSGAGFGTTGAGGRGGGVFVLECGGALNITSTIYAKGGAGTAGSPSGAEAGGGGGGCIAILYGTLTANTGTYTVTGGASGGGSAGAGGAGYSLVMSNTEIA